MQDVIIIGCGVVGAAAAYELSKYQLKVLVLEKENDVANGTSKANSGILHAGYDPHPNTTMARLNIEGARLAKELCEALDVPYKQCGSLVLAFDDTDMQTVQKLYQRGLDNGVQNLQVWDAKTTLQHEPQLNPAVKGALYAGTAAIVSPWEYTLALAETAVRNGAKIQLSSPVMAITPLEQGYCVQTPQGSYKGRYIINAAGVHADDVHNMAAAPSFTILPDRGEYYLLDKAECSRAKYVLFQCPTKQGKGVLVSPTVHGNLIVGPNNEIPQTADDVSTTTAGLATVKTLAVKSVPDIAFRENIRTFSGVRAASDRDDFIIEQAQGAPGFFDLAGIKSPGLTAAPAIAKMAVSLLGQAGLPLRKKDDFINTRKRVRFSELSVQEKQALIAEQPAYGRVICRCETVTEGEILAAIHSPIPPCSVDGVKRRCNAGMGRCQGGFCGPRVVDILARELQLSPLEIQQDSAGSYILTGVTKGEQANG